MITETELYLKKHRGWIRIIQLLSTDCLFGCWSKMGLDNISTSSKQILNTHFKEVCNNLFDDNGEFYGVKRDPYILNNMSQEILKFVKCNTKKTEYVYFNNWLEDKCVFFDDKEKLKFTWEMFFIDIKNSSAIITDEVLPENDLDVIRRESLEYFKDDYFDDIEDSYDDCKSDWDEYLISRLKDDRNPFNDCVEQIKYIELLDILEVLLDKMDNYDALLELIEIENDKSLNPPERPKKGSDLN